MGRIKRGSGEFSATITMPDDEGNDCDHDVVVRFKGYSDPGVCSGPVERCYAPESEMELEVVNADGTPFTGGTDKDLRRLEVLAYEHLGDDRDE